MKKVDIVIAAGPWDPAPWVQAFRDQAPGHRVVTWPDDGRSLGPAPYVICSWKASPEVFAQTTLPQAVFSLGAGVDHLSPMAVHPHIPAARVVDPDLTMRMEEYVSFAVLYLHRQIRAYEAAQTARRWSPLPQPAASAVRVGIMGAGVLGKACAELLQRIGFQVAGWARTRPATSAFPVFAGKDELDDFLGRTDILISLLPNTPDTHGLIGKRIFDGLARDGALGGPAFVNAGRGEVVRQDELVAALQDGTLCGAVLDVFEVEPLADDCPLWTMPNVLITPHVAADSDPAVVVNQITRNIARLEAGLPLECQVDLTQGY